MFDRYIKFKDFVFGEILSEHSKQTVSFNQKLGVSVKRLTLIRLKYNIIKKQTF
jgi:hypothetical protein